MGAEHSEICSRLTPSPDDAACGGPARLLSLRSIRARTTEPELDWELGPTFPMASGEPEQR